MAIIQKETYQRMFAPQKEDGGAGGDNNDTQPDSNIPEPDEDVSDTFKSMITENIKWVNDIDM